MGEGAGQKRAGGGWGGAPESSVGNKACTGSTFWANLTIGLIWLVTRGGGVGGMGQGGGQGGGDGGGAPESSVGATRRSLTSLKHLTIGLIWLGDEGRRRGGGGPGRRARGGRWGGHQAFHWLHLLDSLKNLQLVGFGWGGVGGVGQGGGQGGVDGESSVPVNALLLPRCSLVPPPPPRLPSSSPAKSDQLLSF